MEDLARQINIVPVIRFFYSTANVTVHKVITLAQILNDMMWITGNYRLAIYWNAT